jgi:hypothetical protein
VAADGNASGVTPVPRAWLSPARRGASSGAHPR